MKTTAHWNLWIHTWNKNNRIKHGKEHTYQSQWHKILDTGYKQLKKTRLWGKIPLLDSVGLQGSTLASDISHRQSNSLKGLIIITGEQMAHSFWWWSMSMWFFCTLDPHRISQIMYSSIWSNPLKPKTLRKKHRKKTKTEHNHPLNKVLKEHDSHIDWWSLIQCYSPLSWADSLCSHVILHEWLAFYNVFFFNIHQSGVLTALAWLVPHETAAISVQVLCTPYNPVPCHIMQSHICKVYACLAVTCHLHFWQNDWDLLHATVVTRGGTDTEIRVSTESWPWRRKFSSRFCGDSNLQPFNHESRFSRFYWAFGPWAIPAPIA